MTPVFLEENVRVADTGDPRDPGTAGRPGRPDGRAPARVPAAGSAADQLWWFRDVRAPVSRPPARRRWLRRAWTRDALACLALATLCFSQARLETLLRADRDFYNRIPIGAPTLLALVLSISALAALGFLGAQAIRRARRPGWQRLGALAAAIALLVSLNFARITHESIGRWTDGLGRPGLLAVAVIALAAAPAWPRPALRAARGIALAISPLAALTAAHALWMFLEVAAGPVWPRVDPVPLRQGAPSLRRVVWVVFEALDPHLAFDARPPGLELPELDRLRRESLYADAARPPAGATDISMAALTTGRPVVAVAPTGPKDLELTFADGKRVQWGAHPSVFSRARALGYDTALIGWQLPYPRVLGASLGLADWRPSPRYEQARGATLGQALRNQWGSLVPPLHVRRLSAERFTELRGLAIRAGADGRFGLVLLHLPVPGGPGIYSRPDGAVTAWNFAGADESYADNLALADRLVGDLRRGIDRTRLADRTWMVVSASGWRPGSDHRVPFLVRPPDGSRAEPVDLPFGTLATHDLVLAILRGSIRDADGAASWLARQPMAAPRDYAADGRPIY